MASAPSLWLSRGHDTEAAETVVVGAGIVGLSTAYWLTRSGRRPLVLDADGIASHASGRNAGYLMTGTAEPYLRMARAIGEAAALRLWELSSENREMLRGELLDAGKVDCEFTPEGSWIAAMAEHAEQERELRESGERLAALGLQLEWREAGRGAPGERQRSPGGSPLPAARRRPRSRPPLPGDRPPRRRGGRGRCAPASVSAGWSLTVIASGSSPTVGISSPSGSSWRSTPTRRRYPASPRRDPPGPRPALRHRAGRARAEGRLVRERRLRILPPTAGRHPRPRRLPAVGARDRGRLRGDVDRAAFRALWKGFYRKPCRAFRIAPSGTAGQGSWPSPRMVSLGRERCLECPERSTPPASTATACRSASRQESGWRGGCLGRALRRFSRQSLSRLQPAWWLGRSPGFQRLSARASRAADAPSSGLSPPSRPDLCQNDPACPTSPWFW